MSALERPVVSWMRHHRATVSSEVLAADGTSLDQRKRLVRAGVLERVVDGCYGFAGAPQDELVRCAALCTSRPQLVVAGPTAGRLWDIRRSPRDGVVHVLAPPASHPCREPWVRAYRTALIHGDEIVTRPDGIRVTNPPRTLVDLTRFLPDLELRSAIESALNAEMCSVGMLQRTAERLATPGRPWARRFLGVLATRHPGAPAQSEWEAKVVDALVARGIRDLERQVVADVPGLGRVRFDAAVRSLRWAVEIDVHPEHVLSAGVARDKRRDRLTRAVGWQTERVSEDELRDRFDETMRQLVDSVARRRTDVAARTRAGRSPW